MKIGSLLRRIPLKSRLASIAATRPPYVIDALVLQLVHHTEPKLGALGVSDSWFDKLTMRGPKYP
jgi:hypothetical protein